MLPAAQTMPLAAGDSAEARQVVPWQQPPPMHVLPGQQPWPDPPQETQLPLAQLPPLVTQVGKLPLTS